MTLGPALARDSQAAIRSLSLQLDLPDEFAEQVAQRAAQIVIERVQLEPEGYIGVREAADFLACPTSRIYSLVSAKRIPHYKDGSRLLFDRSELREFVRKGGAKRA